MKKKKKKNSRFLSNRWYNQRAHCQWVSMICTAAPWLTLSDGCFLTLLAVMFLCRKTRTRKEKEKKKKERKKERKHRKGEKVNFSFLSAFVKFSFPF